MGTWATELEVIVAASKTILINAKFGETLMWESVDQAEYLYVRSLFSHYYYFKFL